MNSINRIFKMKPIAVAAASAFVLMATFTPVKTTYAANPIAATEITQLMNNAELVALLGQEATHLAETIKQYEVMLKNLEKLPDLIKSNATNALISLANSTQLGMALTYAHANINAEMSDRFNNLNGYEQFLETASLDDRAARFQDVMQTTFDTVEGALKAANLQMEMFDDESVALEAIQEQMQTAEGQNQLLQAAGSIAAAQVEQMQKLRQLTMAQGNMQAAHIAAEADRKAKEEAGWKKFATPSRLVDPTPDRMSLQEKLNRMRGQ